MGLGENENEELASPSPEIPVEDIIACKEGRQVRLTSPLPSPTQAQHSQLRSTAAARSRSSRSWKDDNRWSSSLLLRPDWASSVFVVGEWSADVDSLVAGGCGGVVALLLWWREEDDADGRGGLGAEEDDGWAVGVGIDFQGAMDQ